MKLARVPTPTRYAATGLALAAIVSLSACGSDEEPGRGGDNGGSTTSGSVATSGQGTDAPTSASTSGTGPSTTAAGGAGSEAVRNIPAAARANTPAGAEAFVKYFAERLNASVSRNDVNGLDGLFVKECTSCMAMVQGIADQRKGNLRISGRVLVVEATKRLPDEGGQIVFLANAYQEDLREVTMNGSTGRVVSPRVPATSIFYVIHTVDGWQLRDIKAAT